MTNQVPGYRVDRDVEMTMRDGAVLRADIWLPDGKRPFAAIVFRTPYNKAALVSDFLRPQQAVEAGFAVVVQDCRGRFRSEGEWRPLMWAQEGEDSYDTVEWVAAQPWCNGAVGMAGPSYLGIVQIAGAVLKPPHLKAIAPAICSVARHERPERGGAFWLDHLFGWTAGMTFDWSQKQRARGEGLSREAERVVDLALNEPRALMDPRPLCQAPLFDLPGLEIGFDKLSSDTATPDLDVNQIAIPVLSSGGWYDLYVRGTIGLFTDRPPGAERQVIVGPWIHSAVPAGYAGQLNFGGRGSAGGGGVHLDHLAFFRKHLLGEDSHTPAVRYFLMGANEWRSGPAWPPAERQPQRLFLRSGGVLSPCPPSDEGTERYLFDPADPTPTVGGRTMPSFTTAAGPIDQSALSGRRDVLRYDALPCHQPIDIVGKVSASIFVQTDAPSFDLVVKLVDVAPDGVALPITDGILRTTVTEAADGLVHRVEVSLADTAWRVWPGHRLRLQLQSANYPHFDANPGTGCALGTEATGQPVIIGIVNAETAQSLVQFDTLPASD